MGAGKNKSHRKNRISKHVLQAEERRKQSEVEEKLLSAAAGRDNVGGASGDVAASATKTASSSDVIAKEVEQRTPADATEKKKISPPSSSSKTKDPQEASSYLSLWKYDRSNNTKQWKFNKNTQSWLLRHMYDFDKVSKGTFALLVEYLCSGGEGTRCRVEEDAKTRARRYKDWERRQKQEGGEEGKGGDDANGGGVEGKNDLETKEKETQSTTDGASWNQLNDHDKRKEFKRARKVLDALKDIREKKIDGE